MSKFERNVAYIASLAAGKTLLCSSVRQPDLLADCVCGANLAPTGLPYISEESHGPMNEWPGDFWLVDPLDGTLNYLLHNPFWSVSIAEVRGGKVVAGQVYCPCSEEFFSGESEPSGSPVDTTIWMDWGNQYDAALLSMIQGARDRGYRVMIRGCCSLALAFVAMDRIRAFFHPSPQPWDFAAGAWLVEHFGGIVTDFEGNPWSLESKSIVATARELSHAATLDLLQKGLNDADKD